MTQEGTLFCCCAGLTNESVLEIVESSRRDGTYPTTIIEVVTKTPQELVVLLATRPIPELGKIGEWYRSCF